jgi:hypothetical protein
LVAEVHAQNTAADGLLNLALAFTSDSDMYAIHTRHMRLPMLVPGIQYRFSTFVQVRECLDLRWTWLFFSRLFMSICLNE